MLPSSRLLAAAAAVLAGLAALAAPAAGQSQAAPALSITPEAGDVRLADDQAKDLVWTVRNTGPTSAEARIAFSGLPAGWRLVVVDPPSQAFTLAGRTPANPQGGSQVVHAVLSPEPGAAPADGALTLTATGSNQLGQSSSASATVGVAFVPPPPAPVVPPDNTPLFVGLAVAAVLLAALARYLFQASRVRLRLSALEAAERAGDRATFLVLVENRSRRARKVELRLRGLAAPWAGALMVPHVLLDASAATEVPIAVSVPRDAAVGDVRSFRVQARPAGPFPWMVARRLAVRVVAEPSTPLLGMPRPPVLAPEP